MADASLDDFFAKKDKTKKKIKTKTSADVDSDGKAVKKDKKKKTDKQNTESEISETQANFKKADEEWVDFEDVKEVDYSGLRIQNMQIAKEEQEKENDEGDEDDDDEDGENREKRSGASGPWNKSDKAPNSKKKAKKEAAPVKVQVVEQSPAPKGPSRYVPPSMRNASLNSSSPSFPSRGKKTAPNVNSEEDFPTLGGGPGVPRTNQYNNSMDNIDNHGRGRGVKLTLENKFAALQD